MVNFGCHIQLRPNQKFQSFKPTYLDRFSGKGESIEIKLTGIMLS